MQTTYPKVALNVSIDVRRKRRKRDRYAAPSARSEFHALPTEHEIAAMGRVSMGIGNGEQSEHGSMLGRDSLHSNFDSVSLERMSKSHARTYVSGQAPSSLAPLKSQAFDLFKGLHKVQTIY